MTDNKYLLLIGAIIVFAGCSSDSVQRQAKKIINPNGDSPLALEMRNMFDVFYEVKNSHLEQGAPLKMPDLEAFHQLEGTEPEKVSSSTFQAMAQSYYATTEILKEADFIHNKDAFNGVVDQCMGCHQALCPGPMVKIKKLYVR